MVKAFITHDDEVMSRMATICDAASVSVYDYRGFSSIRGSKKAYAATIFNRSNTKPDS
jgi:hypothetical protein